MGNFLLLLLSLTIIGGVVCEELVSPNLRRNPCGGSLKADSNSLSYPGVPGESLLPGETCVWTIHLETTKDFRINFTEFDVNASNSSCTNGAVRLYSLSNLVPADRIEEFSFCSENSPNENFYLSGNILVLVLHVSSSNSQPGNGFTINWQGNAFDPFQTKHVTSYSSSDRGTITYPGIGTYESSLAATWLVSNEGRTDFQLSQLTLESCSNSDPCTCDALLVYEINSSGYLSESTRYCSNVSSPITTSSLPNSFVLAFFTDFIGGPNGANNGFSALYYPVDISTEPTTPDYSEETTAEWTTTPSAPTENTTPEWETTTSSNQPLDCGGKFTAMEDSFEYKVNSHYEPNERCVWIIYPPYATQIKVTVTNNETQPAGDGVLLSIVDTRNFAIDVKNQIANQSGVESFVFNTPIVIVTFFSNENNEEGYGFQLSYDVVEIEPDAPSKASAFLISFAKVIPESTTIRYPADGGNYGSYDLAAFVYSPNFRFTPQVKVAYVTEMSMEPGCGCCDLIYVFEFNAYLYQWIWSTDQEYMCGYEPGYFISSSDMQMFIFKSDRAGEGTGFKLDYSAFDSI